MLQSAEYARRVFQSAPNLRQAQLPRRPRGPAPRETSTRRDRERATSARFSAVRRRRDPRMREEVLTAYEYQCAFCGYDGRIGAVPVGLEAAHVRWWAFDGPDDVDNGLCLCSLHHKLFDKGVLGIGWGSPRSSEAESGGSHRILVSQRFVGHSPAAREHVVALAGRPLIGPQPGVRPVAATHLSWHTSQVFHGIPRPAPAA
ncbi:HNH endonuclease [Streptomyces humidus]